MYLSEKEKLMLENIILSENERDDEIRRIEKKLGPFVCDFIKVRNCKVMNRDDFWELIDGRVSLEGLQATKGPTLSKVLVCLGKRYGHDRLLGIREMSREGIELRDGMLIEKYTKVCDRKLLNDDGTDATLFDQSEETKNKVSELFRKVSFLLYIYYT